MAAVGAKPCPGRAGWRRGKMGMSSMQERTTLSVKDFGPIAEATIDLRPFTVFVGASNTGKSYLAILLYALHQFFGSTDTPFGPLTRLRRLHGSSSARREISAERAEAVNLWLQQTQEKTVDKRERDVVLPDEIAALVRPILQDVGEAAPLLDDEVKRCFGLAESADLIRQPAGRCARVVLRRELGDNALNGIGYDFAISRGQAKLSSSIPADMPLRIPEASRRRLGRRPFMRYRSARYPVELADLIVSFTAGAVVRPVHYLPADRTGVMHAHRVVVSSLIGRASRAGFDHESPLPTLSGVLADFLARLIELSDERRPTESRQLADRLETDILGGSVQVLRSTVGYPSFHYRPAKWKRDIALMNTSSMVSELAPVVLYLRHVVRKGDVIIIEEPESHLHPQMQVAFTGFLAAVVKAGIRVIVTTHSEWVLETLANLVRLSEVPKSRRSEVAAVGPALTPDEVGAWLFEPKLRPKGSVVKEIPLDTVRGTFPAGFGDITEGLYNDWATIANLARNPK